MAQLAASKTGWRSQVEVAETPPQETAVTLSIVVPLYNESANIQPFYERLAAALGALGETSEIIFVNDGSEDDSVEQLLRLHKQDSRVKIVDLSRNFGKEVALTAGMDQASGEAVIPIDADLQDPPELIRALVAKWREGLDVVYATRIEREGESWFKQFTAALFYRVIGWLANIDIPKNTGDFRLLSRPAVDALKQLREHHRFMKGLFSWVGFKQASVPYRRDARFSGNSKWNYWRLLNLAIEGITSFSYVPLQLATLFGLVAAIFAFSFGAYILIDTLLYGNPVRGYASLMVVITFLGGVQLICLGIIGEYLARTYSESKQRPLYLVRRTFGFTPPGSSSTSDEKADRDGS